MTDHATDGGQASQANSDEVSLIEILSAVLRNWRAVLLLPVLFALAAGVLSLSRDRSYVATASFMPQAADTRGASGAAALAQQFGISLGADRPGHSPEFYKDLLESAAILRRAVESDYQIPRRNGGTTTRNLVQHWKVSAEGGPLPPWRMAVERLRRSITASVARETGVIGVTVSADHPVLAEQITSKLLDLLNDYNLEMRQQRAREEARFISGRMTEVQGELARAEEALELFLRKNRNFRNSPELTFEHDRLQRQVAMRQEIYTSLLRGQEQARIDGVRDTPLLTIIDPPAGTSKPVPRRTILRAVIGFMLGFLLAIAIAAVKEAARRARHAKDPRYREFEDLVRRVWGDIRRPSRWVRNGEKRVAAGND
jgi:uncharacterized protein involved in exopolysaccharide biosynthesis